MCCICYKGVSALLRRLLPTPKREVRLLILGLDNAGKTSLVDRLAREAKCPRLRQSTGGASQDLMIKGKKMRLWDLNGQLKMRQNWRNYYSSTNALIYVVDSSDAPRLAEARCELCDLLLDKRLDQAPLLVLANKQDAAGALPRNDVAELLGLSRLEGRPWLIQDCSALTGSGVEQVADWIYQIKGG